MDDLDWIKGFSKITISGVCKELKIDRGNVLNGKASAEKIAAVRKLIENKFDKLYE